MAGPPSLDPLRYGLRALEEMAREQASVLPPPKTTSETFAPHPVLRTSLRDGAALSLRLFTELEEDATSFVVGEATSLRLSPIPARAGTLFEAHASVRASEGDDALTLGFPLVTFVQQGSARAAPLFSLGGARAAWSREGAPWKVPPDARAGVPMPLPDVLDLAIDEAATYAVHGGVWHLLFGLDGAAVAWIGRAASAGLGALVRAATRVLETGDAEEELPDASPLRREDLEALCEAAMRRASPGRALRCYPLGLVMLPPRGDPTSALRTDLRALLDEPAPRRGPLAVFLGAEARAARDEPVWASGGLPPTPSQLAAARAFEGTEDLVAVCGPPGCGKTALLHLVTAQTVVACALAGRFSSVPERIVPWPLVVTSTNNAAVDTALAPFVSSAEGLPLALRLGNRRTLAEVTGPALVAARHALERPPPLPLEDARVLFEARAKQARALLRARKEDAAASVRRDGLVQRVTTLRETLRRLEGRASPSVPREAIDDALAALREHADAASKLAPLHLVGERASVARAAEKWARANELRRPRVAAVLDALGLAVPFGPLDEARALGDIAQQREAIEAATSKVAEAREVAGLADARVELAGLERELASLASPAATFTPDPELYRAALALREGWARAHRGVLGKRLEAAIAAVSEDRGGRSKPISLALQELAPLFPVAGSTLLSMRASFPFGEGVIDRLVVDEAAQCAPIHAVPALARAKRAMLTGDVAQLPPVYTLDARADERLATGLDQASVAPFRMGLESTASAQAVGEPRAKARLSLVEHFRSQPPIVALASRWSGHSLDVRTPPRSLASVSPRLAFPVLLSPVPGIGARAPEGVVNESEAEVAVLLVGDLLADGISPSDVAVLTPFVGQSIRIERMLLERGLLARESGGVLVSTVHKLQGGERRVVIFSVTATSPRHLRWLRERPHLLHVATSRAQDHLVVLVSPEAAANEPCLAPLLDAR